METWKGVVRGRTPKARTTEALNSKGKLNAVKHFKLSITTNEEETEAGGRIPSFPQTEAVPEHPSRKGGECEEKHRT